MSGRITLASEIEPQPRLYTILLGESADTRKSTAIKKTLDFFRDALPDFPVCFGVGSAEGLAQRFLKNNRLLLLYDEARAFVNKAKIETSVLLQAVNTLFELNNYESTTKKHSIEINNAHLSLLGASTPETYSNMFNSQFLDIGFLNRIFVVQDQGRKMWSMPPRVSPQEKDRLKQHLDDVLKRITELSNRSTHGIVDMGLTGNASARWDAYYFEELPSGESGKRLDTYGLRLMPLLAINDSKTQVDFETVERVITILKWEYETRILVDPIDADSMIAKMEEGIRRVTNHNGGGISSRDLKRAVNYQRSGIYTFNAALRNLMKEGEVRFDPKERLYYALQS
jgi:hypothetical protein